MNAEHFLLAIIIGLSGWTLLSVVQLREQMARYRAQIAMLPCQKCPSPGLPMAAAIVFLLCCISAFGATNALDLSSPEVASGSRITSFVDTIPWQTLFDWFASVTLPALFALWRKHAANSKVLTAIITAVEQSSVSKIVKQEIQDQATASKVQPQLDKAVQNVTGK